MKRYIKSNDSITRLNDILHDGDTPKKLPKNFYYEVEKWDNSGLVGNYGRLSYSDTIGLLRGFHYDELFPGDGMWNRAGCNYSYSVEISKFSV